MEVQSNNSIIEHKWALYKALKEKVLRRCREDSYAMTEYVFKYSNAPFHRKWHDFLRSGKSGLILALRGSGKSEQCTIGNALWEIGKNPNIIIKIVTETDDLAGKLLSKIAETILTNERYREVFPDIEKHPTRSWNMHELTVKRTKNDKEPTVEAQSILAASTGKRADLIQYDDICFDDKTEILTKRGWYLFKDVLPDDVVATLNNDGYLEWQTPVRFIDNPYSGTMYAHEGKVIDFCVTPKHNMFVSKKENREFKGFSLVPIEDIYNKSRIRFKRNCLWRGTHNDIVVPSYQDYPEVIIDAKLFAAFLGFFIAEGFVRYQKDIPRGTGVCQNEGLYLDQFLAEVVSKLPFKYAVYTKSSNGIQKCVSIGASQLAIFMTQFGRGAKNKYIPDWVLEWDRDLLNIFFDWYQKGDGDKCGKRVYTASEKLKNNLLEIALKCGFVLRETKKITQPVEKHSIGNNGTYFSSKYETSCYALTINKKQLVPTTETSIRKKLWKTIDYNGRVYCVTVPNGIIYVRRNKIPLFAGNCGMNNTLVNPAKREIVKEAFRSNWQKVLNVMYNPKARWIMTATPWHINDLVSELRNNKAVDKAEEIWVGPNFESPWPGVIDEKIFKKALQVDGLRGYNRAYRGIALSDDETWINPLSIKSAIDWELKPYDVQIIGENTKFTGVDLGHREGENACPSVIFTGVRTPNGKRIPIDIKILKHSSVLEIAKAIIKTNDEFKPAMIFCENNGAQKYLTDIISSLGPAGLPIEGHFTGTQKLDPNTGVPSLLAEIETGRWVVPLGAGGEHEENICDCPFCIWLREIRDYPLAKTDTVMACWLMLSALKKVCENANSGGNFSVWEFA